MLDPVSVISVVGPYHTGKSFLLNSFLQDTKGFEIGSSTNPQTLGIWALKTDLEGTDNSKILLIDTEGFYGSNVSEIYDAKLFAIVTLLSSHLIFNSIKTIDQASVDYLEVLSRRTQLFQLKTALKSSTCHDTLNLLDAATFPYLTWVVKDFVQDLQGRKPIDYLNDYIGRHRDKGITDHNLDQLFPFVDCHTLFLPATDLEKLQDLSTIDMSQLTPEFKNDLKTLQESVMSNVCAKSNAQGSLTGASLTMLLRFLVHSANENLFPELPSLWSSWLSQQTELSLEDAINVYKQELDNALSLPEPPSDQELLTVHKKARADAIKFYKDALFGYENLYSPGLQKLEKHLRTKFSDMAELNRLHIANFIHQVEDELVNDFQGTLQLIEWPINPKELSKTFNSHAEAVVKRYKERLDKYKDSTTYELYLFKLKEDIKKICDSMELYNNKMIDGILHRAYHAFVNSYESRLQHSVDLLHGQTVNPANLESIHLQALNQAQNKFDAIINLQRKNWMKSTNAYKSTLALAKQTAQEIYNLCGARNEELIKEKADIIVEDLIDIFGHTVYSIFPFPDDESILTARASNIANSLLKSYDEFMAEYKYSPIYSQRKKQLQEQMVEIFTNLLERNIMEVRRLSGNVFLCAKERVEQANCWYCLSNWWPPSHKSLSFQIAKECFEYDAVTKHLPWTLKHKAVKDWYDTDMAADRLHMKSNMQKVLIPFFTLTVGTLAFYLWKRLKHPRDITAPVKAVVKLWAHGKEPIREEPIVSKKLLHDMTGPASAVYVPKHTTSEQMEVEQEEEIVTQPPKKVQRK